jgi:hypothetical protein
MYNETWKIENESMGNLGSFFGILVPKCDFCYNKTMSHVHKTSVLRASTMAFLLFGIALIVSAHGELYLGQLTAQLPSVIQEEGVPVEVQMHEAAPDPDAVSMIEQQLALGMMLVLAGFFTHALCIFRGKKKGSVVADGGKGPRGNIRPAYMMK